MPNMNLDAYMADDEAYAWACVFCKTGSENALAEQLCDAEGVLTAFSVRQVQHKSEGGQRTDVQKVMLPGYVFIMAEPDFDMYQVRKNDYVLRVLTYGEHWALQGNDLAFAKWMHQHGGVLGVSKAFRVGQKVVIASGPLKELEGVIQKVDRHNRNGLVTITFCGRETKVWLAFEYITEESN